MRQWAEAGAEAPPPDKAAIGVRDLIERIQDVATDKLEEITGDAKVVSQRAWLAEHRPELAERVTTAVEAALARFAEPDEDAIDRGMGV